MTTYKYYLIFNYKTGQLRLRKKLKTFLPTDRAVKILLKVSDSDKAQTSIPNIEIDLTDSIKPEILKQVYVKIQSENYDYNSLIPEAPDENTNPTSINKYIMKRKIRL